MRVAFFDFTINFGGAPQGSVSLAQRIAEQADVHVIDVYGSCPDYVAAVLRSGLRHHVLFPGAQNVYIGYRENPARRILATLGQLKNLCEIRGRLVTLLSDIKPDLVWVNNEKSLVFLLGPALRARFATVYYVRNWATRDQVGPLLAFLLRRRVTAVLAHSRASVERLKAISVPAEKITYTPNAVDIDLLPAGTLRGAVDLPGAEKPLRILLPAARPVREKGHLAAVKALRVLVDAGLDPVLWLPGKLATGAGNDFTDELKRLIARLSLKDRVHFIGWRSDLQRIIAGSDVVILPSHTEGFPRVVIEAMLLQVPVCATPVGGIPEAITDGVTGFLIPVDDAAVLADRISRLHADRSLRERVVRAAHAFAVAHFDAGKQTEIVVDVFSRAIADAKRRRR